MGIRPKIMTVFGIDNYTGKMPDLEKEIKLPDESNDEWLYVQDYAYDYQKKEVRWYHDLIYVGQEYNPGILGFIKSEDYDSDTFRVLAMLYPEFFESGHKDVPIEPDEMTRKHRLRGRPAMPCGNIKFQNSWFYPQGFYWITPVWAFMTKWLLDSLGIETDPTEYKWMLVWEWS